MDTTYDQFIPRVSRLLQLPTGPLTGAAEIFGDRRLVTNQKLWDTGNGGNEERNAVEHIFFFRGHCASISKGRVRDREGPLLVTLKGSFAAEELPRLTEKFDENSEDYFCTGLGRGGVGLCRPGCLESEVKLFWRVINWNEYLPSCSLYQCSNNKGHYTFGKL